MAKQGHEKSTNNRDKHNKLIAQKINKKKSKEINRKERLKEIIELAKAKKAKEPLNKEA
jgi:hypothetical protein